MTDVLSELTRIIQSRMRDAAAEDSYVASLHAKGLNKILEKVSEECAETLLAAKDAERSGDTNDLIYETADLWFHSLVMLAHMGVETDQVLAELARRFNMSGLVEKAARTDK